MFTKKKYIFISFMLSSNRGPIVSFGKRINKKKNTQQINKKCI